MLRQVVLSMQMQALRGKMDNQDAAKKALEERRAALAKREADLEAAVQEVTAETSEEDKATLNAAVEQYETDNNALTQEEAAEAETRSALQKEIDGIQRELEEIEQRAAKAQPAPKREEKGADTMPTIENRRSFFGMSNQERDAFFAREDTKNFIQRLRDFKMQSRTVSGSDLLIPDVFLGVIREQIYTQSKMLKHVNLKVIKGTGRVIIPGAIPEGVWTEMCAKLNELNISFNSAEVDGYKVGGFFAVCNAVLADAEAVDLAMEFVTMISAAIAKAVDKAILFGKGTKMPMGIVTRLAQKEKPSGYSETARAWEKLSETNVVSITAANSTGIKLYQNLCTALSKAKSKYSNGTKVWAMNEATHLKLVTEAMNFNAVGAIVTGASMVMPVVGGTIEVIDDVPDNMIVAGYGDCYLMVEREGVTQARSEHVRFLDDQTVFKGTARYDGLPVIPEAFVFIGISGTTPAATTVTFAEDAANAE